MRITRRILIVAAIALVAMNALAVAACGNSDGNSPTAAPSTVVSPPATSATADAATPADTTPAADQTSPPAPAATPTAVRNIKDGEVTGPLAFAEAITNTYGTQYVADLATGAAYALKSNNVTLCWLDDTTLVDANGAAYRLDPNAPHPAFDPDANPCAAPPENRLTPRAGGRTYENPEPATSADGLWSIERNESGQYITGQSHEFIAVPDTGIFSWSPAGHTLAIGGGWCRSDAPLTIVHPDTAASVAVSGIAGRPLAYIWQRDASGIIVADAYGEGPRLRFARASDGVITSSWPSSTPEQASPIIPLSTSPSGKKVLFYLYMFRPCS